MRTALDSLLTIAQVCARLDVSESTLYRLADAGAIAYVDVASRVDTRKGRGARSRPTMRFLAEDVDDFIARRRRGAAVVDDTAATASTRLQVVRRRGPAGSVALPGADRYAGGPRRS